MKQKTFEKSSDKIWKLKIKVLTFAAAIETIAQVL
jgi:hypothetical protein